MGSLDGTILDQFIRISSTSTTCRIIFNLERKVSSGYKDDEDDDDNNGASSQEALCNDPYCTFSNHRNKGASPRPPPPPPPTIGGYFGEGATQFAMSPHY